MLTARLTCQRSFKPMLKEPAIGLRFMPDRRAEQLIQEETTKLHDEAVANRHQQRAEACKHHILHNLDYRVLNVRCNEGSETTSSYLPLPEVGDASGTGWPPHSTEPALGPGNA